MIYSYPTYKRLFYLSIGWILVGSLLQLKEINILLQGNADGKILFRIIFSLLFLPACFVISGLYLKSINIITNNMGIEFKSWFRNIHLKWEEINEVRRFGEKIKVRGKYRSLFFNPLMTPSSSTFKITYFKITYKENIYKQSALLKEIFLKVQNVPFKNFPKGTFDELKSLKSSQKTNAR